MLNLKNNENDSVFDEICKKKKNEIKIKFQKNEEFFNQHSLVEKSPTTTDIYIFIFDIYVYVYLYLGEDNPFVSLYE